MSAPALSAPARRKLGIASQTTSSDDVVRRLFAALTPLHELGEHDSELLTRAAAGHRFIRAMQPFGSKERSLMRIALADLPATEAFVVVAASSYAADTSLQDELGAWDRLLQADRRRIMWFAAILRLAESIAAVCANRATPIHVAWTDEVLYLEIDGVALSVRDTERVLGRAAAIEAATDRRVLFTSSARRRGAA